MLIFNENSFKDIELYQDTLHTKGFYYKGIPCMISDATYLGNLIGDIGLPNDIISEKDYEILESFVWSEKGDKTYKKEAFRPYIDKQNRELIWYGFDNINNHMSENEIIIKLKNTVNNFLENHKTKGKC